MIFDILEKWKSSCPGKISESCWTDVQIYDLISFFYLRTCRWSGESQDIQAGGMATFFQGPGSVGILIQSKAQKKITLPPILYVIKDKNNTKL